MFDSLVSSLVKAFVLPVVSLLLPDGSDRTRNLALSWLESCAGEDRKALPRIKSKRSSRRRQRSTRTIDTRSLDARSGAKPADGRADDDADAEPPSPGASDRQSDDRSVADDDSELDDVPMSPRAEKRVAAASPASLMPKMARLARSATKAARAEAPLPPSDAYENTAEGPDGPWTPSVAAKRVTRAQVQNILLRTRAEDVGVILEQRARIAELERLAGAPRSAGDPDAAEPPPPPPAAAGASDAPEDYEIMRQHNELLKAQLKRAGVEAIGEVVSFVEAKARLCLAAQKLLAGEATLEDEREMTRWDEFIRAHPQHQLDLDSARQRWLDANSAANAAAHRVIQGFVPPDILSSGATLDKLHKAGLCDAAARRVLKTPAIWLTRVPHQTIAKTHIADLRARYNVGSVSLLELRAVFYALPEAFEFDALGEKLQWRDQLFSKLQGLVAGAERLPREKRAPKCYGAAGDWADLRNGPVSVSNGPAVVSDDLDEALLPFNGGACAFVSTVSDASHASPSKKQQSPKQQSPAAKPARRTPPAKAAATPPKPAPGKPAFLSAIQTRGASAKAPARPVPAFLAAIQKGSAPTASPQKPAFLSAIQELSAAKAAPAEPATDAGNGFTPRKFRSSRNSNSSPPGSGATGTSPRTGPSPRTALALILKNMQRLPIIE